eukprot:1182545-Prorocentrum_minimum.AAC.2
MGHIPGGIYPSRRRPPVPKQEALRVARVGSLWVTWEGSLWVTLGHLGGRVRSVGDSGRACEPNGEFRRTAFLKRNRCAGQSPIRRSKHGHILTADQSDDAASTGIFSRRTN